MSSIWIYKIQNAVDGNLMRYKERFVTRGFSWKKGVDYEETFATTRILTGRFMCAKEGLVRAQKAPMG